MQPLPPNLVRTFSIRPELSESWFFSLKKRLSLLASSFCPFLFWSFLFPIPYIQELCINFKND